MTILSWHRKCLKMRRPAVSGVSVWRSEELSMMANFAKLPIRNRGLVTLAAAAVLAILMFPVVGAQERTTHLSARVASQIANGDRNGTDVIIEAPQSTLERRRTKSRFGT